MNEYHPDKWTIVRIKSEKHGQIDKVLGSWYGGFASSDSWLMNGGISKVEEDEQYYDIVGFSGSVYHCHKETQGMSAYTNVVYDTMKLELEKSKMGTMEIIDIRELTK